MAMSTSPKAAGFGQLVPAELERHSTDGVKIGISALVLHIPIASGRKPATCVGSSGDRGCKQRALQDGRRSAVFRKIPPVLPLLWDGAK